ncbi:MAG: hypothetical protein FNT29_06685 [Halothiobacillaceae bacterium]|nr:MAG: hypothetical protein FNT29_06685 [Halothiobacillaceae bacterium]
MAQPYMGRMTSWRRSEHHLDLDHGGPFSLWLLASGLILNIDGKVTEGTGEVPNLTRQDGSAFERLLLQNFHLPTVFPIFRDAESETGSSIHDRAEEKPKAVRHG